MKQDYIVLFCAKQSTNFTSSDLNLIQSMLKDVSDDKAPLLMGFKPNTSSLKIGAFVLSAILAFVCVAMIFASVECYDSMATHVSVSMDVFHTNPYDNYYYELEHKGVLLGILAAAMGIGSMGSLLYVALANPQKKKNYKDIMTLLTM